MAANAQGLDAETFGRVGLSVESCPSVPVAAVRHILGVEIGDLLLPEGSPSASLRLTIRCAGNVAWVEAAGEGDAHAVDRTLSLDAFPGDASPRALVLAGLELLAARSPAVRARMEANPKPPAELPAVDREPRRTLYAGVAGTGRRFFAGPGLSTWGGQARLGWILRPWHISADIEASGASRDVRLGETSALMLSGSAAFGLIGGPDSRAFSLMLGARMGMARLAGSAADPTNVVASTVLRPWGGPMASLGFLGIFKPLAVVVAMEAGRSLFTAEAQAESATVLTIGGTWVALSLGAAIVP
jgi:hypothetical protein